MDNRQSRSWLITINNPRTHGYSQAKIAETLESFKSLRYWCLADEIGENATYHTHVYVAFTGGVRFSTLKSKFPHSHIEVAKGTAAENREYINKSGKWQNSNKNSTIIAGTFKEWGIIPQNPPAKASTSKFQDIYELIVSGASDSEIIKQNPSSIIHIDKLDKVRQTINAEAYKNVFRQLEVNYLWGETNTGKTSFVVNKYGYDSLYRVTNYKNPFDDYSGEDVMVFEEFNSQFKINDMLNYLDGHPLKLPCRYMDKQAAYTKVYIISNWYLEKQYPKIQQFHPETWRAFLRRIHNIIPFPLTHDYREATSNADLMVTLN